MTRDEFEELLALAMRGVLLSDTGASDAVEAALFRVAELHGDAQGPAIKAARQAFASESPSRRR